MRSKQYFTSIKNNPHEISTDPLFLCPCVSREATWINVKKNRLYAQTLRIQADFTQTCKYI